MAIVYRTFRDWSSRGYTIKKGAKADRKTERGEALFSRCQVVKPGEPEPIECHIPPKVKTGPPIKASEVFRLRQRKAKRKTQEMVVLPGDCRVNEMAQTLVDVEPHPRHPLTRYQPKFIL